MKKLLTMALLGAVSTISFAEAFSGPYTSTYNVTTTANTTKTGIFTGVKGKIDFSSSVLKLGTNKGKVSDSTTIVTGTTTTTVNQAFQKTTTETNSIIEIPTNDSLEPESKTQLSGSVFNFVDTKLILLHNDNVDSSSLALSKVWGNTFIEWVSYIDFSQTTLFAALTRKADFKIRNRIGDTEGQLKTVLSGSKLQIDSVSDETYIKFMFTNLDVYLRPYDVNWSFGIKSLLYRDDVLGDRVMYKGLPFSDIEKNDSVFYNDNFDVSYKLSLQSTDVNPTLFDKNGFAMVIPGVEAIYNMGNIRIFGAINTKMSSSTKNTVDNTPSSNQNTNKTVSESIDSKLLLKIGANAAFDKSTILYSSLYFGNTPSETKTNTKIENKDGSSSEVNQTGKNYGVYLALNLDGQTRFELSKTSAVKLRGEFDFRNYAFGNDVGETKTTVSTGAGSTTTTIGTPTTKENANKLGVFLKATLEMKDFIDTYISIKGIGNGYKKETDDKKEVKDTHVTGKNESSVGVFETAIGAEKKIDAVTLNLELKFVGTPVNDTTNETKTETSAGITTATQKIKTEGSSSVGVGFKARYEF